MIVDKIKKRQVPTNHKTSNIDIPVGKWIKCEECKEILYKENVRNNLNICPHCGHYFRMNIDRRLELILDKNTYNNIFTFNFTNSDRKQLLVNLFFLLIFLIF